MGLACKNSGGDQRFALRFLTDKDSKEYADANKLECTAHLGRWKLHGVPVHSGPIGVYSILEQRQWKVHEILYFNERHSVFLAIEKGDDSPLYYQQGKNAKQLKFEALNAIAKGQQAASSQAARIAKTAKPSTQAQSNEYWKKAATEAVMQDKKRTAEGNTGSTPEKAKARQT